MKKLFYIFLFCLLVASGASADRVYWYNATSLIGGATSSLDSINGQNLVDGDKAIVATASGLTYFYSLDSDSGLSESSPSVISPDSNAGNKRWVRIWESMRVVIPDSTVDQGDNSVAGTLAWHITNAAGSAATVTVLPGTHLITTDITVPATMKVDFRQGGIFQPDDATAKITFNSPEHIIAGDGQQIIDSTNNTTDPLEYTNAGIVHIGWYGASADGSTDDSVPHQMAATAAAGGTLTYLSGRTYVSDQTDVSASTIIDLNGATIKMKDSNNNPLFKLTDVADVTIKDGIIDGNGANNTSGDACPVYATEDTGTLERIKILNLTIHSSGKQGIYFAGVVSPDGGSEIEIRNNNLYSTPSTGAIDGISAQGDIDRIVITGNQVDGYPGAGINVTAESDYILIDSNIVKECGSDGDNITAKNDKDIAHTVVTNNLSIGGANHGIHVGGSYVTVVGNDVDNPTYAGIFLKVGTQDFGVSTQNVISSNTIKDAGSYGIHVEDSQHGVIGNNVVYSANDAGIYLETAHSFTITGNSIDKTGDGRSSGTADGIDLRGSEKCVVVGNIIEDTYSHGISLDDDAHSAASLYNRISSNIIHDAGESATGYGINEANSANHNHINDNSMFSCATGGADTVNEIGANSTDVDNTTVQ